MNHSSSSSSTNTSDRIDPVTLNACKIYWAVSESGTLLSPRNKSGGEKLQIGFCVNKAIGHPDTAALCFQVSTMVEPLLDVYHTCTDAFTPHMPILIPYRDHVSTQYWPVGEQSKIYESTCFQVECVITEHPRTRWFLKIQVYPGLEFRPNTACHQIYIPSAIRKL